jgi:hypothetical protein
MGSSVFDGGFHDGLAVQAVRSNDVNYEASLLGQFNQIVFISGVGDDYREF